MGSQSGAPIEMAYRRAIAAGIATLLAAMGLFAFPASMGELSPGLRTPILAFELARTRDEVETLFGAAGSAERQRWVVAMDLGNRLDFGFMVAYGAALILASRAVRMDSGSLVARGGEWLAVVGPLADAAENVQLLTITSRLGGSYDDALARLAVFTSIKWCAIALVLLSWVPAFLRQGRVPAAVAGLIVLTAVFTATALLVRGLAAEGMALGVALSLAGMMLVAALRVRSTDLA